MGGERRRGRREMTWGEQKGGWTWEEEKRTRGTVCRGTGGPAGARSREEEAAAAAALGVAAAAQQQQLQQQQQRQKQVPATQRLLPPEQPQSPRRDGAAKPGEQGSQGALAGGRPGTAGVGG